MKRSESQSDALYREAIERADQWLAKAGQGGEPEPTAMALSTVGDDGRPSARMMLLKGLDDKGLVFYTNSKSNKCRQLAANSSVALCLFWPRLERQVRVEGQVSSVSDAAADAYFATRPRGSQIGSWASHQSETLESREVLERRVADFENQYAGKSVPRPPYWSGFLVRPRMIEFWQGHRFRLHERWRYEQGKREWTKRLLNP